MACVYTSMCVIFLAVVLFPLPPTPSPDSWSQVAQYLASSTFDCISQVFANANAVKEWLRRCAQTVVATGSAVHWTTPLGLPVLQPYVRPNPVQVGRSGWGSAGTAFASGLGMCPWCTVCSCPSVQLSRAMQSGSVPRHKQEQFAKGSILACKFMLFSRD